MQKQHYFEFQKTVSFTLIQNLYNSKKQFLWMDSNQKSQQALSYLFYEPIEWIQCNEKNTWETKLKELNYAIQDGYWVAGIVNYEFGEQIQNLTHKNLNFPYFQFGVYEKPSVFKNLEIYEKNYNFQIQNLSTNIAQEEYIENIYKILDWIKAGQTYQINYTFFLEFDFFGSALEFYLFLREQQKTKYSAFVFYNFPILSLSPELFFKLQGNAITTKPMKGTTTKKLTHFEELKNKAENFMITDLLRNDLGKICKLGSIKVKNLFQEENYSYLKQFTSTIKGQLQPNLSFSEIILALFPSGSITGAPKREAMKKISILENQEREIYTGSIGYFSPKRKALFNIAIRTVQINEQKAKIGIGSGIVFDSKPIEEWKECFAKAKFLLNAIDFDLFETVLFRNGKFFLKKAHIKRILNSCDFFQIPVNKILFLKEIKKLEKNSCENFRFKWKIDKQGNFSFERTQFTPFQKEGKILIAKNKINSKNIFLYHKTTEREFYNLEFSNLDKKIFIDKIFLNEKEEITEGCITNIFVKIENVYYTPPQSCGLLKGTYRTYLLKKYPKFFREKILKVEDLQKSQKIFICNSIRGIVKVESFYIEK